MSESFNLLKLVQGIFYDYYFACLYVHVKVLMKAMANIVQIQNSEYDEILRQAVAVIDRAKTMVTKHKFTSSQV